MSDTSKPFTRTFVLNLPGPDMEVTATKAQEVFEALPKFFEFWADYFEDIVDAPLGVYKFGPIEDLPWSRILVEDVWRDLREIRRKFGLFQGKVQSLVHLLEYRLKNPEAASGNEITALAKELLTLDFSFSMFFIHTRPDKKLSEDIMLMLKLIHRVIEKHGVGLLPERAIQIGRSLLRLLNSVGKVLDAGMRTYADEIDRRLLSPPPLGASQGLSVAGKIDPSYDSSSTPNSPPGTTNSNRDNQRLPESRQRAFGQYLRAAEVFGGNATDRNAFDWLVKHGELEGSLSFESWSRYLREARKVAGQNKNTPRRGRESRSSVGQDGEVKPSGQETD